jgi:hypothetical protein
VRKSLGREDKLDNDNDNDNKPRLHEVSENPRAEHTMKITHVALDAV